LVGVLSAGKHFCTTLQGERDPSSKGEVSSPLRSCRNRSFFCPVEASLHPQLAFPGHLPISDLLVTFGLGPLVPQAPQIGN
ncbi:hypothetical protein NDU88_006836, partial [Pleurodeles waltl]